MSASYDGVALPLGWLMYRTEDEGKPYFHHAASNVTQWEPPTSSNSSVVQPPPSSHSSVRNIVFGDTAGSSSSSSGGVDADGDIASGAMLNLSDSSATAMLSDRPSRRMPSASRGGASGASGGSSYGLPSSPTSTTKMKVVEYQSLPTTTGGSTSISGSMAGDIETGGNQTSGPPADDRVFYFIYLSTLQSYFNVSTDSVLERLKAALLPTKLLTESSSLITAPDLYGPFWLSSTLVLLLFAASNSSKLFAGQLIETDYVALVLSFFMIYGLLAIVPLAAWGLSLFLGNSELRSTVGLRQLFCLFGYSYTIALPVILLSLLPSLGVRWLLAAIGVGISLAFFYVHLEREVALSSPTLRMALGLLLLIAESVLYFSLPLHYFSVV